jgi:hypothetical protein
LWGTLAADFAQIGAEGGIKKSDHGAIQRLGLVVVTNDNPSVVLLGLELQEIYGIDILLFPGISKAPAIKRSVLASGGVQGRMPPPTGAREQESSKERRYSRQIVSRFAPSPSAVPDWPGRAGSGPDGLQPAAVAHCAARAFAGQHRAFCGRPIMKPASGLLALAFIIASGIVMAQAASITWAAMAVTGAAAIVMLTTRLDPLWLLAARGALGGLRLLA